MWTLGCLQGAKLLEGHIALYSSGLDANAKQFASLHAVQRHMVDTNQCKMVYEGVEEEYEDFYDYSKALADIEGMINSVSLPLATLKSENLNVFLTSTSLDS